MSQPNPFIGATDTDLIEAIRNPSQKEQDIAWSVSEALARLLERSAEGESAKVESLGNFRDNSIRSLSGLAKELDAIGEIETALRVRNFIVYLEGLK